MRIIRTESFKRDFKGLPARIQRSTEKALRLFISNPRYPSLRIKKMGGHRDHEGRDVWEGRITQVYRFTFAIDGDMYILYRVGPHAIERHPL